MASAMFSAFAVRLLAWMATVFNVIAISKGPFDICEVDIFNGTCPRGKMIIMTSAMYGRMSIGSCIRQHFSSHRNCDGDVLNIIDGFCSGRQSCVVRPIDPVLVTVKKCPEHSAYLRLSYDCIKSASGIPRYCSSEQTVSSSTGYLSSAFIQEEGTRRCPWVIGSHGNQKFNFTLYKFVSQKSSPLASSSSVCFEIGTIQDGGLSQGILSCGSDPRVKVIHVSKGGPVKIHFKEKSFLEDLGTFVFHFHALECGEPQVPDNAVFKRTDNKGMISCTNQDLEWTVDCKNGEWVGEVGTCHTEEKASVFKWIKTNTSYSIGLLGIVVLICALVIFLGGFCVYVTYFYATRQNQSQQNGSSNYESANYNMDIYKLQTMQRLKASRPPSIAVYERTTSLHTPPGTMRRNTDYQRMNPIDPDTVSHHSYVLYDHVPKPLPPIPIQDIASSHEKKHIYETPLPVNRD